VDVGVIERRARSLEYLLRIFLMRKIWNGCWKISSCWLFGQRLVIWSTWRLVKNHFLWGGERTEFSTL